jgi:hypothetical protein
MLAGAPRFVAKDDVVSGVAVERGIQVDQVHRFGWYVWRLPAQNVEVVAVIEDVRLHRARVAAQSRRPAISLHVHMCPGRRIRLSDGLEGE